MSAKPCGCDDNAGWVCKVHGEASDSWLRFAANLAAEQTMSGTVPAVSPVEATPLEEQCIDTQRMLQQLDREIQTLVARAEAMQTENDKLRAREARCASVLATFYRAPLSMSSVQPLLTLAEELNPSLKERA